MDVLLDRPEEQSQKSKYAGFWIRTAAYLIDAFVFGALTTIVGLVALLLSDMASENKSFSPMVPAGLQIANFLLAIAYYAGFESSKLQATPGKMAVGIKVIDKRGERIELPRAAGRFLGKILSAMILLIGFIMVAFDKKKQGLHDMMAGTYIVYK